MGIREITTMGGTNCKFAIKTPVGKSIKYSKSRWILLNKWNKIFNFIVIFLSSSRIASHRRILSRSSPGFRSSICMAHQSANGRVCFRFCSDEFAVHSVLHPGTACFPSNDSSTQRVVIFTPLGWSVLPVFVFVLIRQTTFGLSPANFYRRFHSKIRSRYQFFCLINEM